jgi:MFS family permease
MIEKNTKFGLLPWLIWSLAALFYFYKYFIEVSPSVMEHQWMQDFNLSANDLGKLGVYFLYAYAPMQIIVGVLLDRYGPRRLLTLASAVCGIACLLFALAKVLAVAALARFLAGFGCAFAVVSCFKLASNWFPPERFAFVAGATVMIGMLGAIFGQKPLALLVNAIGWRQSSYILAAVGIGLALLIFIVVRDMPKEGPLTKTDNLTQDKLLAGLIQAITSKQTWLAAIYGGLMFGPTVAMGDLWGVDFLMHACHTDSPTAAGIMGMLFVGWAVGSPIGGWLSDYIGRRMVTMAWGAIGALLLLLTIIYVPNLSPNTMRILWFSFGLFSSGFLPAFSLVREMHLPQNSGAALGFMNTLNMVGGMVLQRVMGWLLDQHWAGQMENGTRVYSLENFHSAMIVLPISIAIAIVLLPFIRETYCKPVYAIKDT